MRRREGGGRRSEGGGRRAEVGHRRLEVGHRRSEGGGQRSGQTSVTRIPKTPRVRPTPNFKLRTAAARRRKRAGTPALPVSERSRMRGFPLAHPRAASPTVSVPRVRTFPCPTFPCHGLGQEGGGGRREAGGRRSEVGGRRSPNSKLQTPNSKLQTSAWSESRIQNPEARSVASSG
jgi:hypothetical protein